MDHSHVMGGSSAAKRVNCPASLTLEDAADLPEGPPSEFAERGSMLHAAMELMLAFDPQNSAELETACNDLLGQSFDFDKHYPDMEITQELIDTKVLPAWNTWVEIRDEYDFDDWMIEQQVNLEVIIDGAFGTSDLIAKDKQGRLHILDWKFGDGVPVPAEENLGMLFYAAGALFDEKDEELMDFIDELPDGNIPVFVHIVQPRAGSKNPRDTWETDVDTVNQFVDTAADSMRLARSDDPPTKAGSWCRWCGAKHTCPAQTNMVVDALSKPPASMSALELGEALKTAKLVRAWADDVFKLAQKEMEGGAGVPGFKLVSKQPRRVWADQEAAEEAMRKARVPVKKIFPAKMISPTELEKQFPKVYSKIADICVSMHSSGLTVVPDSDKRQAVTSPVELLVNVLPKLEK